MTTSEHKGFTLVETLIAVTVLVVTIVVPLYAVHRAVIVSYTARDTLVATALAQEAVEYVRHVRDSNYLANRTNPTPPNWLSGLNTCLTTTGCTIDPHVLTPASAIRAYTASNAVLYLDNSYRYRFNTNGTTQTRFSRKVTMTTNNLSPEEVLVTVEVTWITSRISYNVTVTEYLRNWQ